MSALHALSTNNVNQPSFISPAELAMRLGVCERVVRDAAASGKIQATRVSARRIAFTPEAVESYLASLNAKA